mmetsp:Transcript_57179/g.114604  ORF Transcript_57179/g.114604 Transcript_57179/m.114604 type:complete len:210 (+) Transcript_57179:1454-2083(+)
MRRKFLLAPGLVPWANPSLCDQRHTIPHSAEHVTEQPEMVDSVDLRNSVRDDGDLASVGRRDIEQHGRLSVLIRQRYGLLEPAPYPAESRGVVVQNEEDANGTSHCPEEAGLLGVFDQLILQAVLPISIRTNPYEGLVRREPAHFNMSRHTRYKVLDGLSPPMACEPTRHLRRPRQQLNESAILLFGRGQYRPSVEVVQIKLIFGHMLS